MRNESQRNTAFGREMSGWSHGPYGYYSRLFSSGSEVQHRWVRLLGCHRTGVAHGRSVLINRLLDCCGKLLGLLLRPSSFLHTDTWVSRRHAIIAFSTRTGTHLTFGIPSSRTVG